ncbi:MAG: 3-oxoacyl-[acyl-carrier-protein] reductase [Candidatus Aminicenantes bacterium]|nr:3-oxoacyl-[acyl-carrier-protein] reductase [Candidatus Aminicenantes bacterium]
MLFENRISIITGASQGIGETIAREFAAEGATVVLVDIQKEKLESVAAAVEAAGGRAVVRTADVSRLDQATAVAESVVKEFGKIDHLVNNAGITRDNLLLRMKEEEWDAVIGVNLKGIFNFSKAVVRTMLSARSGRIVNMSSIAGAMGNPGQTNYSAAKAGLIGFTKSLAREVGSRGITVNAVAPGCISTAMFDALPDAVKQSFLAAIPLQRFGEPVDVAGAVRFLCSDAAAYITGQVIHVNGGLYM